MTPLTVAFEFHITNDHSLVQERNCMYLCDELREEVD